MNEIELRQYLELLFNNLKEELRSFRDRMDQLSSAITQQGATIHQIEINTTHQIVKMEGDLNRAFDHIRDLEKDMNDREAARQESDISLGRRISDFQLEQKVKWDSYVEEQKKQAVENDKNKSLRALVFWLATIVATQVVLLIWSMIMKGGIQGLIP